MLQISCSTLTVVGDAQSLGGPRRRPLVYLSDEKHRCDSRDHLSCSKTLHEFLQLVQLGFIFQILKELLTVLVSSKKYFLGNKISLDQNTQKTTLKG